MRAANRVPQVEVLRSFEDTAGGRDGRGPVIEGPGLALGSLGVLLDRTVAGTGVHAGRLAGQDPRSTADARKGLKRVRAVGLRDHRGGSRTSRVPRHRRQRPQSRPGSVVTVEAHRLPDQGQQQIQGPRRVGRPSARVGRNRRRAFLYAPLLALGAAAYLPASPIFNGAAMLGLALMFTGTAGFVLETGPKK